MSLFAHVSKKKKLFSQISKPADFCGNALRVVIDQLGLSFFVFVAFADFGGDSRKAAPSTSLCRGGADPRLRYKLNFALLTHTGGRTFFSPRRACGCACLLFRISAFCARPQCRQRVYLSVIPLSAMDDPSALFDVFKCTFRNVISFVPVVVFFVRKLRRIETVYY